MKQAQYGVHAGFEESHWWFTARRRILAAVIREVLPPGRGHAILDVGCGTGGLAGFLSGDYDVSGIDASEEALSLARSRFPRVRFLRCADPRGVPPEDRLKADLLILGDVLEHVADDRAFLAGLLAGCRPGAHVLITVPADPALWSGHDRSFGHFRRYEAAALRALWRDASVSERLFSHYNARLYPVIRGIRRWNAATGRTSGEAGTDFARLPRPVNALLRAVFAGEAGRLRRTLRDGGPGYARGASLIALLRVEPPGGRGD